MLQLAQYSGKHGTEIFHGPEAIGTGIHKLVCGLPAEGGDSVTVNGN